MRCSVRDTRVWEMVGRVCVFVRRVELEGTENGQAGSASFISCHYSPSHLQFPPIEHQFLHGAFVSLATEPLLVVLFDAPYFNVLVDLHHVAHLEVAFVSVRLALLGISRRRRFGLVWI